MHTHRHTYVYTYRLAFDTWCHAVEERKIDRERGNMWQIIRRTHLISAAAVLSARNRRSARHVFSIWRSYTYLGIGRAHAGVVLSRMCRSRQLTRFWRRWCTEKVMKLRHFQVCICMHACVYVLIHFIYVKMVMRCQDCKVATFLGDVYIYIYIYTYTYIHTYIYLHIGSDLF